jgi:predicted PurR-regulated permease PerM
MAGLIFLLILFVVDYLVSIIRQRFAHRIDPFMESLHSCVERLVTRDAMQATLSRMFSCCCIFVILIGVVGATIFTVYKVQNDLISIKKGI